MGENKPRVTLGGVLGWVAGLSLAMALARVSPGLGFMAGTALTIVAILRHVPAWRIGKSGLRLDEAMAALVLLLGLTILSAPSMNRSFCVSRGPGDLARRFRDSSPRNETAGVGQTPAAHVLE